MSFYATYEECQTCPNRTETDGCLTDLRGLEPPDFCPDNQEGEIMDNTLHILPGEGEVQTVTRKRVRQVCEFCGEPAHYKHTFLLPDCRSNPASKGYGKDDCSWCEDAAQFSCKNPECQRTMCLMEGYRWCATFPASERFAHMFLYWEEQK